MSAAAGMSRTQWRPSGRLRHHHIDPLEGSPTHDIPWRIVLADQNIAPIVLSEPASNLGCRPPDHLAVMAYPLLIQLTTGMSRVDAADNEAVWRRCGGPV